ncbi:MAG: DUF3089 domain-containing protein [Acidaminococcaceae bacterium]
MRSKRFNLWRLVVLLCCSFSLCWNALAATPYEQNEYWAVLPAQHSELQAVDVFFVCPMVDKGFNMSFADEESKAKFVGAIKMEQGIYDAKCNFFAPFYRQMGLAGYRLQAPAREAYLKLAYSDVREAFEYYLQYKNAGRPFILAGFSQGADMVLRLLKDDAVAASAERMIAAYALGWQVTPQEVAQYPQLKMAQGASDTGVVISFNAEAPHVTTSLPVPERTCGINPLHWRTDSVVADKALNLGAVFTNYEGEVVQELPHLTGAYLDKNRGTLKVTDIANGSYPSGLDIFPEGVYHLYDYQFFYRNLQANVAQRIAAYYSSRK